MSKLENTFLWGKSKGGGGATQWGQITGTISDQTDLNNKLNEMVTISTEQTITGNKVFEGLIEFDNHPPVSAWDPTSGVQLVNRDYVSNHYVSVNGAQNISGLKSFSDNIKTNKVNNISGALNIESTGDIFLKANGSGNIICENKRLIRVGTPTATTDGVNKNYVDLLSKPLVSGEETDTGRKMGNKPIFMRIGETPNANQGTNIITDLTADFVIINGFQLRKRDNGKYEQTPLTANSFVFESTNCVVWRNALEGFTGIVKYSIEYIK